MALGVCKLCLNESDLKKSHAISNSIFRKIFRSADGKGILISNNDDDIAYTIDSWKEEQLCHSCEQLLSSNYEKYAIEALRGRGAKVTNIGNADYINDIDVQTVLLFVLSVYWRGAHSSHKSYGQLSITDADSWLLRKCILENKKLPMKRFAVRIYKLIDSQNCEPEFEGKVLKEFIASPYVMKNHSFGQRVVLCFAFEGLYVEIIVGGLTFSERKKIHYLKASSRRIVLKHKCIFDIPELIDLMCKARQKHDEGRTKIK